MAKRYFLLIAALLVANVSVFSQSFSNGSFEIAYDSCLVNIPHNNTQNIVPGLYSYGTSQGLDFRANSCPLPAAVNTPLARHGSKYLLFGNDGTGGDSIALALTSPLFIGQTYKLGYAHRRQSNYTSPIYEIGYSNDSNSFGQLIGLGHCQNFGNVWEDTNYTFTPTASCRYITLRSILNGELLYLDNFSITSTTLVKGITSRTISCYPNPFNDYTIVHAGNALPPFNIQVYDMTGKIQDCKKDITQKDIKIYKADLPTGVYFLKLSDKNNDTYYGKIIAR